MHHKEPIAIIGTGCRFPGGASSPSKLWELLRQPRDVLTRIPADRFNPSGFYHEDGAHHGATNVQESYVLSEDIRLFDASFFKINGAEAHSIDPQQRLLLETVYESLESAGLPLENVAGSDTAVFVGLMSEEYSDHLLRDPDTIPTHMATGTARSILSNRISYVFDMHGPSVTVDTACSSSLVAVHMAVQALRNGESRIAIAAGSNLIMGPEPYIAESKLKMLSPGSRSRMWDASADGYARGEGFASIVLKTLSAAIADGDDIECIIRETGVNQDGRGTAKGITVPSAAAQTRLILETYQRAGLNAAKEEDRCQFFQCHGTGTPAGDPVEAEAISDAFFGDKSTSEKSLLVGSVKTVIGHTEGTAGLAGLLTASLGIQNGFIPPNLLFSELNPAIAPFYGKLKLPLELTNVNSFGFGGTNAHAILESYSAPALVNASSAQVFTPASIRAYSNFLKTNPSVNLLDLVKASVPACSDNEELIAQLDALLERAKDSSVGTSTSPSSPRILGVFTGQGAQYAGMGKSLILQSPLAARRVDELQKVLDQLPAPDRPDWKIRDELLAEAASSRLGEAALSQPLCTVIQVILVEMLRSAGVEFAAVVGHSSGEIGAAFAAGYISAEDALKIAYYRGIHTKLAGSNGKRGAMMADFAGRICVAASNSPTSTTLSGDAEAIDEAKLVMDDEKKFARVLKVDKAYHSHHMQPCREPYIASLRSCNITVQPNAKCKWYSSVYDGNLIEGSQVDLLKDTYWADNMCNEVLFMQAVQGALQGSGPFTAGLEVGPHPALKGPALDTIVDATGAEAIPYSGVLDRGKDAVKASSDALAFLWTQFGRPAVDFNGYQRLVSQSDASPKILKNLPGYSWDHDRAFWYESRASRVFRSRSEPLHILLGSECSENAGEYRWKNNIQPKEIPWLSGHQLQGSTVFPAAAYVSTAIEATRKICRGRELQLIELEDINIGRAISFEEGSGAEVIFTLRLDPNCKVTDDTISAEFTYHSASSREADILSLNASGRLLVTVGPPVDDILPSRGSPMPNLVSVDDTLFYNSLTELGYEYSGPFRAVSALQRASGYGSGVISTSAEDNQSGLLVHPATLDCAFQSSFLALCWPGDGTLRELHVPVSIRRIRVVPNHCHAYGQQNSRLPFESILEKKRTTAIHGDVNVYAEDGRTTILQIEGINVVPLTAGAPPEDRPIFSTWTWNVSAPDGALAVNGDRASERDLELASVAEQASIFYLVNLKKVITPEELAKSEWHHKRLFEFADNVINGVRDSTQPFSERHWLDNTREQVYDMMAKFPDSIELKMVRQVGENLPAAVRGETQILEHMMVDGLLNRFYEQAIGVVEHSHFLSHMVEQMVHKNPRLNILEIGAGTGGATKRIFNRIGHAFSSYTFTDISTGFFEKAQEVFREYAGKMIFKSLDCEQDIEKQGYEDGKYDLIVASLVIHATKDLDYTMSNVRRLLKPGGYLVILELTDEGPMRFGFLMGGLPGWWLGGPDRKYSPCMSPARWHTLMQKTGFSGIDTITPEVDIFPRPCFVIATQAVDDKVNTLREPLQAPEPVNPMNELVIVGGAKLNNIRLVDQLSNLLKPWATRITRFAKYEDVRNVAASGEITLLSVAELDEPIFKAMTPTKLRGIQSLLSKAKTIQWVTKGGKKSDPFANMTAGFLRSLQLEMPQLSLQLLDIDEDEPVQARTVAEIFLRHHVAVSWSLGAENQEILWLNEPELRLEDGLLLVPRLKHLQPANDRYNSARRPITKEVSVGEENIVIQRTDSGIALVEQGKAAAGVPSSAVAIRVQLSVSTAVQIGNSGSYYLVLGRNSATGATTIALSSTLSSLVEVPRSVAHPITVASGEEASTLQRIFSELIASRIVSLGLPSGTLLVHGADADIVDTVQELATESGLNVAFSSASVKPLEAPWIAIHPFATEKAINAALPSDVRSFVDLTRDGNSLSQRIKASLPLQCLQYTASALYLESATGSQSEQETAKSAEDLAKAIARVEAKTKKLENIFSTVSLDGVSNISASPALISWTAESSTVPVKVSPIETKIKLKGDRTYVLFGLTSDLGQSLCQWMVDHGARNLVMTSRNPKVDQAWIQRIEAQGVTVAIRANDITSRNQLQTLIHEINSTLPPIAGIVHGAMVLQDALVLDMAIDNVHNVLRPKVDGARFLNEFLADTPLDFFIMTSSMAAVGGNKGQSMYGAANMCLAALVNQRRSQGKPASVIHMGPVMGAGWVAREASQSILKALQNAGYRWLSERDFHLAIAEAIVGGDPNSNSCAEFVLGVREKSVDTGEAKWYDDPKFQHCVIEKEGGEVKNESGATASSKARLATATTSEQVREIIEDAFINKLQVSLQTTFNDEERVAVADRGADELGIDSLIAVEIRSWFISELKVDMPVLKILGGTAVKDLLAFAVDNLPADLTPNLNVLDDVPVETLKKTSTSSSSAVSESSFPSGVASSDQPVRSGEATPLSSALDTPAEEKEEPKVAEKLEIVKTEIMSLGQLRFWSLMAMLDDPTTLNIVCAARFTGPLRVNDLANAVKIVAHRHEALRTCFFVDEEHRPTQGVLPTSFISLLRKTISSEQDVSREFEDLKSHAFDLERGETMKVLLLTLSETQHFLLIGYHHIIMDGVSLEIFLSDLVKAYNGHLLSSSIIQPTDFAARERDELPAITSSPELKFWKKEFANLPKPLPLFPFAQHPRLNLTHYDFESVDEKIPSTLSSRVKEVCKKNKITPFHFYLAAFKTMLFHFLNIDDLCIGISDANRLDSATIASIGVFLNLLPLRFRQVPSQTITSALREAKLKAYSALASSKVPFDLLLKELDPPRSATHTPLFQCFMNYRQGVQEKRKFGDCVAEMTDFQISRSGYDVTLDIIDNPGGEATITFMVQKGLYTMEDALKVMRTYLRYVQEFAAGSVKTVDQIPLHSEEEISKAIALGQGPMQEPNWPQTLVHRVDDMIAQYPSRLSLKDTLGNSLSYQKMGERIRQMAAALQVQGIGDNDIVGVFQEPTVDWVCSLLAIMRVGATYVPMDIKSGLPRLVAIVQHCKPAAVMVHGRTAKDAATLEKAGTRIIDISDLDGTKQEVIAKHARPDGPALIVYTSGSTGTPKGIVLTHANLCRKMEDTINVFGFRAENVLQQSPLTWDASIWEVFMAIANGGTLIIADHSLRADALGLTELIERENITFTFATPAEYSAWLTHGNREALKGSMWRKAICGGDKMTSNVVEQFELLRKRSLTLFNAYGPAEVTLFSNAIAIPLGVDTTHGTFPAGFTTPSNIIYILDDNLRPLPLGYTGQIAIGGFGLATKYLRDDDLSSKKFVPCPFAPAAHMSQGWSRMHVTGDKGRLREDGALFIEGRMDGDTQLKLRGMRIDLQDIESTILSEARGALSDAVVSVRDAQILVGHVVFSQEFPVAGRDEFLDRLLTRLPLPQYMCPSKLFELDEFPLTAHAKVDRQAINALPLPVSNNTRRTENLMETEQRLLQLWQETISADITTLHEIGPDSDFFRVGGNSILLVSLQAIIRRDFDTVLPLAQLFECSTLGSMAAKIDSSRPVEAINWEAETALEPGLITGPRKASKKGSKEVLLTGATGHLGRSILRQLVNDPAVSRVHCVAVRLGADGKERSLPVQSDKIKVYPGNLSEPGVGILEGDLRNLAEKVDVIIHSAAQRSFWDYYQLLRQPNFGSVKELVKFAVRTMIPIHFISSGAVLDLPAQPPTDGSDGYVASKWAAERYLHHAAHKLDLPVVIHRTVSSSTTGAPVDDALQEFAAFVEKMQVYPVADGWNGEFDLVPMEDVASGIAATAVEHPMDQHLRIKTYEADIKLSGERVAAYLQETVNLDGMKGISALEWVGKAKKEGWRFLFASQSMTLESGEVSRR
ncbi:amino acid adenylation domain-containing protein [Westerdykella ornata]|uniref:Amino acid adenylation domain-containing protein n=1 Tax=Westerdykella ornata TaxID=318751 RepID=A0A6A6J8V2_WESOR|nr:amino acid adenylation domain-containing protein [Westerdykella ornata]KAF2271629.1 amino acid adenylation domain-containing protein [Westerdykella ornata]